MCNRNLKTKIPGLMQNFHRRRKRGGEGATCPPKFQVGGASPLNFTHCLHNELYCSIVDRIACSIVAKFAEKFLVR